MKPLEFIEAILDHGAADMHTVALVRNRDQSKAAAEREACAIIAEEWGATRGTAGIDRQEIADAIRARP